MSPVDSDVVVTPPGSQDAAAHAEYPDAPARPIREMLQDTTLHIIFGVTAMVVMGVTSVAPAFTRIMADLDVSAQSIGLLLTVFTLPGIILTPLMGILADRYGRRPVLIPSLALFGLAGGACSIAPDYDTLLFFRFLQGMGASALGALNITILGDAYQGRERITALGLNASVLSLGVATYPILGGALAQIHWRLPFLLPLTSLGVAWFAWRKLVVHMKPSGLGVRAYFESAWKAMKQPKVLAIFGASLATFLLIYGSLLSYLPVHLGDNLGGEPYELGLILSSSALLTAVFTMQIGRISSRIGVANCIKVAFGLYALAHVFMVYMPSLWWFLLPVMLFGMAQGLNIPSIQAMMTEYAPPENRAGFLAMNGMVLRLGQTLGPLLMSGAFLLGGMDGVFWAGALVALAMVATAVWIYRGQSSPQRAL